MSTPAATPPGAQGTGAAPAQPGQGQGNGGQFTGEGQGQGGFNWGLFPNVPEEQRSLLEPHLRGALGHVTQIEQQYAPYKAVIDSGLQPDQLDGLVRLSQAFDEDPVGTWYSMAQQLAQNGTLPEDLDIEELGRILQGIPDPADQGQQQPGQQGAVDPNIAALTQQVQQLTQQLQGVTQYIQSEQTAKQERTQDQLFQRSLDGMKSQLTEAGFPDGAISDEDLTAYLIAARGDSSAAVQRITGLRDGVLKGFTETATQGGNKGLNMPNGAPPAPDKKSGKDSFANAKIGAEQYLRQANQASAQQ